MKALTIAGSLYLNLFVNGRELYAHHRSDEPRKTAAIEARLHARWKLLTCKASHCTRQGQLAMNLEPLEHETLAELRYSTVAKP